MSDTHDFDPTDNIQLWADYDELFQTAVFLKKKGLGHINMMTPQEVMFDIYTALSVKYDIDFEEVDASLDRMEEYNKGTNLYLQSVLNNRKKH